MMLDVGGRWTLDGGLWTLEDVARWTLYVELHGGRWALDVLTLDIGCWTFERSDVRGGTLKVCRRALDIRRWTLDDGRWTSDIGRRTLDVGLVTLDV